MLKFIYSEKATKFCKISTVDLTGTTLNKSTVEILRKNLAFFEYTNFNIRLPNAIYAKTQVTFYADKIGYNLRSYMNFMT